MAKLEHVSDLDGRRDVAEAKVVRPYDCGPDGDTLLST